MDLNAALKAFIRTVEKGSMTGAARDLGISQPAVTKHLLNLERHLNARLLERSPQNIRPTAHGMELYEASRGAIASIDAALEGIRLNVGEIEGNLRIHAPSCIGSKHLHGILLDFQDLHPKIAVDLVLDDRTVDLIYENFDLTLRYGRIEAQEVIARRFGWMQRILVAAPSYLERVGEVRSPEQLSGLSIISTFVVLSGKNMLPLMRSGSPTIEIPVKPVFRTNDAHVLLNTLLAGRGIGQVQWCLVTDLIAEGRLARVLPAYAVKPTEAFLAYPSNRFMRPVVRAFTDFVMPRLKEIEGISQSADDLGCAL
ncbi:LysR family transcriptional regulator [Sinorhizobium medicae]|uniref:LysR family transcriptional regulator n=1 Tax=Sinorhizobium TaxID=28105 RepID=UPI000B49EE68|nr:MULTISPECIES: LysR family transcriptional regulator [Sinorhizobium]ASP56784.1 LysR family transcriptional regulator [Sinorhizobium meliloti]MDW9369514.1 LysR family transcriptional regulator [Sinorhizobium meliloti]MDW9396291.1 LysR family transcriptional regulator [Sinorhizobium meliloti]MDW9610774.1 LysR family transcriptional regulator [Sinorhizobium meliloti]MDW9837420.1 LysR family transcriptional regulator [Sinorhizobium meliloti]